MRLRSFTIQGFANFVQPITFGPLDEVNVVYGPNNSGKSNLLRSLELYFRLLGVGEAVTKTQQQMLDEADPALIRLITASICRTEPMPLVFTAEWSIAEKILEQYGLFGELSCHAITTVLQLQPNGRTLELRVQKWKMGDKDVAAMDRAKDASSVGFAQQIRRLLSDATPFKQEKPVVPYAHLARSFEPFPQALRDALFDARQSRSAADRKRWAIFARAAGELSRELGEGSWDTVFERDSGRADVIWNQGETSVLLSEMGSGVQRLAGLLGEVALAKEPYVCFEEPEWRLSPELQARFIRQARQIIRAGVGPRQVFMSTHSPSMTRGATPFALELDQGIPVIEQRPWIDGSLGSDSPGDAAANVAGPDLDQLVGLVEELAELDPDEIIAEEELAPAGKPAGKPTPAGKPAPAGKAAPWAPAGKR